MQKHVNLVDLVKSFPTNIFLQKSASIQPRTSHLILIILAASRDSIFSPSGRLPISFPLSTGILRLQPYCRSTGELRLGNAVFQRRRTASEFRRSGRRFRQHLEDARISVSYRCSFGSGIDAACGQLFAGYEPRPAANSPVRGAARLRP